MLVVCFVAMPAMHAFLDFRPTYERPPIPPEFPYVDVLVGVLTVQTLLLAVLAVAAMFATAFKEGHDMPLTAAQFAGLITAFMLITTVGAWFAFLGAFDWDALSVGQKIASGSLIVGATAQPVLGLLTSMGLRE